MARITLRPTIASDLPHVIAEPLPCRVRTITALAGNRVIGVGGLAFPPGGPAIAFVQLAPASTTENSGTRPGTEARHYPVAFHRAGLMAMTMIHESALQRVIATADANSDRAVRWLKRLGFKSADCRLADGKALFIWERQPAGATVRPR